MISTEISSLVQEINQTQFYIEAIEKSSYQQENNHNNNDNTSFVLKNSELIKLENEIDYYLKQFEKLGLAYFEQERKEKFMKAILDIPPQYCTVEELEESKNKILERQSILQANENELLRVKNELIQKCASVTELHAFMNSKKLALQNLAQQLNELQEEDRQLTQAIEFTCQGNNKTLDEAKLVYDNLEKQEQELEAQLLAIQQKADIQDMAAQALEEELSTLEQQAQEAKENVDLAMLKAAEADPGVEELTKWFKQSNLLMSRLLGISSIRLLKGMTLEVVYQFDRIVFNNKDGVMSSSSNLSENSMSNEENSEHRQQQEKRILLVKMSKSLGKRKDEWMIYEAETEDGQSFEDLVGSANKCFKGLERQLGWFLTEARQRIQSQL